VDELKQVVYGQVLEVEREAGRGGDARRALGAVAGRLRDKAAALREQVRLGRGGLPLSETPLHGRGRRSPAGGLPGPEEPVFARVGKAWHLALVTTPAHFELLSGERMPRAGGVPVQYFRTREGARGAYGWAVVPGPDRLLPVPEGLAAGALPGGDAGRFALQEAVDFMSQDALPGPMRLNTNTSWWKNAGEGPRR